MTAVQPELIDETTSEAVLRWRFEELVRSGYDIGSALVLASHVEIDLHDASSLTHNGCPPETALRILLLGDRRPAADLRWRGAQRRATSRRARAARSALRRVGGGSRNRRDRHDAPAVTNS